MNVGFDEMMDNELLNNFPDRKAELAVEHEPVLKKIKELYQDLFLHDGFGELRVSMRFLKKGQKEIIVICGKEFRFVLDYPTS